LPGYSGLYRVGPLTHLKMCVLFSALHCLPRGSSLKVLRLRYCTAKKKSLSELHIFVSAVHCPCQHSKPCRFCVQLISQLKLISTLFIYYKCMYVMYVCNVCMYVCKICTYVRYVRMYVWCMYVIYLLLQFINQRMHI